MGTLTQLRIYSEAVHTETFEMNDETNYNFCNINDLRENNNDVNDDTRHRKPGVCPMERVRRRIEHDKRCGSAIAINWTKFY